ncbi:uncharacterized protein LOC135167958 [Diachasmimorpha longicaudata]|uniref:uncharacterized protein LOC135167958 n=1 Tax=Diachasmimorpha longicaudata TaxID=58733 RepID=UPI0030B87E45
MRKDYIFNIKLTGKLIAEESDDFLFNVESLKFLDSLILIVGSIANFFILLALAVGKSVHNSTGSYIFSLTVSNIVSLLDILEDVLQNNYDMEIYLDRAYTDRIVFQSSLLTIIVFSIDRYLAICCRDSTQQKNLSKTTVAIKAVFIIWAFATVTAAFELHLYELFRGETGVAVYVFFTTMYLIQFCGGAIGLNVLTFNALRGRDRPNDVQRPHEADAFRLLGNIRKSGRELILFNQNNVDFFTARNVFFSVGIISVFVITILPDTITTILYYVPLTSCCKFFTMCATYYLKKFSIIMGPIVWTCTCQLLRKALRVRPFSILPNMSLKIICLT